MGKKVKENPASGQITLEFQEPYKRCHFIAKFIQIIPDYVPPPLPMSQHAASRSNRITTTSPRQSSSTLLTARPNIIQDDKSSYETGDSNASGALKAAIEDLTSSLDCVLHLAHRKGERSKGLATAINHITRRLNENNKDATMH